MINWNRCIRCGSVVEKDKQYCKKCEGILKRRKKSKNMRNKSITNDK
ncbi:hypothetical protein [Romboutsia sp. 1001285H_161024_C4]|nr:hypothetical protein [Romboutsia sp. 1001285H_161024_C4]